MRIFFYALRTTFPKFNPNSALMIQLQAMNKRLNNTPFIAIEGVIGVGKTTLTRLLAPYFEQTTVLLEVFEENPFLAGFYQDRGKFAFQTQLFFLLSRYHQQHEAVPTALQNGTLVADYTFAKDELFAWLNLKDDELAMYGRVHAALGEKIPKPVTGKTLYRE